MLPAWFVASVPFALLVWSKHGKFLKCQKGGVALADQLYPGWVTCVMVTPILLTEVYLLTLHFQFYHKQYASSARIVKIFAFTLQQFVQFLGVLVISARKRKYVYVVSLVEVALTCVTSSLAAFLTIFPLTVVLHWMKSCSTKEGKIERDGATCFVLFHVILVKSSSLSLSVYWWQFLHVH